MADIDYAYKFIRKQYEEAIGELNGIDADWNESAYFKQQNIVSEYLNVLELIEDVKEGQETLYY